MRKKGFFCDNSRAEFLDGDATREERERLTAIGCEFLSVDAANKISHQRFFDLLRTRQVLDWPLYETLPVFEDGSYEHVPIPFHIDVHDEQQFGNRTIAKIVEDHVNSKFDETKYLFSGDPRNCLALRFEKFSYEILYLVSRGHLNNPFVLFDSRFDKCFLIHFDLCVTVFSRKNIDKKHWLGGIEDRAWISYFNRNFVSGVKDNGFHIDEAGISFHINLVNTNYVPRLPGVNSFASKV